MKDEIVKIVNEFSLGKQDFFLIIQYIDNICIINSRVKKISLTISDDDYWSKPCLYGDYIVMDDETLAWDIQFNSKVINDQNLKDLLRIMNNIFFGKKIIESEDVLSPMPHGGYYSKDLLNEKTILY